MGSVLPEGSRLWPLDRSVLLGVGVPGVDNNQQEVKGRQIKPTTHPCASRAFVRIQKDTPCGHRNLVSALSSGWAGISPYLSFWPGGLTGPEIAQLVGPLVLTGSMHRGAGGQQETLTGLEEHRH